MPVMRTGSRGYNGWEERPRVSSDAPGPWQGVRHAQVRLNEKENA